MEARFFDFAVLGDSHPEGLLLSAGLARRGYHVCLVPSQNLGELPSQDPWPLRLPSQMGKRHLDDLLFKVGFFRLEDSGLVPMEPSRQILLKKHRLSFNGSERRWEDELRREFPRAADKLVQLKKLVKSGVKGSVLKAFNRLNSLGKDDPELLEWVRIESLNGRPAMKSSAPEKIKNWVSQWRNESQKIYRISPSLGQPFSHFLTEHARKWGTQVIEESIDLKTRWNHYQLLPHVKSKNLILNSLAAMRLIAKMEPKLYSQNISHWLYFDRIQCSLDSVPEPLEELSFLDLGSSKDSARTCLLYVSRDKLKDRASLALGVWLDFNENKDWISSIEKARQSLKRLLAFLPPGEFKSIPSVFELTELKGECVRRGETERIAFENISHSGMKNFINQFKGLMNLSPSMRGRLSKRIYVAVPHSLTSFSRQRVLEDCLRFLEHYERRAPQKQMASIF